MKISYEALKKKWGELQPNCRTPALRPQPQTPTHTTTYGGATLLKPSGDLSP